MLAPVAILLAGVACHLLAVWTASRLDPAVTVRGALVDWDGSWYLRLAEHGYGDELLGGDGPPAQSTLGFYPLYPALVRTVVELSPLGWNAAGLLVAIAAAAGAAVAVHRLATGLTDDGTAIRAVALVAFAPGALVLSMTYSESTFMLLAALCLLALHDRRWPLAGGWGALACLTRPNSLAVLAACGVAALVELRRYRRDVRPLVAPALAAAGFAALPLVHLVRVGDPLAYWKTQRRGWGQGFDLGWSNAGRVIDVLRDPAHDFNLLIGTLGIALVAGGLVCMWWWRPPAPVIAYTLVVIALALGSNQLVSTMRFAMTAFPLAIAYARVLRGPAFGVAMGVSAALLGVLSIAATTLLYTP